MATISLQHIQKIYPIGETSKKQKAFLKKAKEDNPETNKVNLKITEEGVVAVDDFNLEVKTMNLSSLSDLQDAANQRP